MRTALMIAIVEGDTPRALDLIGWADINPTDEHGRTALMIASAYGHEPCVRALIAAGANINIDANQEVNPHRLLDGDGYIHDSAMTSLSPGTALMIASAEGHEPCVRAPDRGGALLRD